MTQITPSSTLDNLSRLAAKPGVQSTLILSKADGTIIQSTGLQTRSQQSQTSSGELAESAGTSKAADSANREVAENPASYAIGQSLAMKSAEDVARMVFSFVAAAGDLVDGLDDGNDLQLLRLRTRKNEIVIVPDSKYLLIVIHDQTKGPYT